MLLLLNLQSQTGRLGRLKKVMKYVFSGQPELREACSSLLRVQPGKVTPEQLLEDICQQVGRKGEGGRRSGGEGAGGGGGQEEGERRGKQGRREEGVDGN